MPIYRFLLRLCGDPDLAADLAQETLLRGWKARRQLRGADAAKVWLFRIAVNVWKDRCRTRQNILCQGRCDDQPGSDPTPEDQAAAKELGRAVWRAIDLLPERQKQIMHLRMLEQMEPGEIAQTLQLSPALVRSNLAAARRKLRQLFEQRPAERQPTTGP
ncbi:MAG: RNA polymerase sigma factor [Pirellulales bacterium]|nr:RNA polymerase sigma factor [Pirellulales bacterium]